MTNDTVTISSKSKSKSKPIQPIVANPSLFHKFFDERWYLRTYPDVHAFTGTPQDHYLRFGYFERRSPHPLFDLSWYLERHPEIAEANVEPLSHYFEKGWRFLQSPHPLFDPAWYLLKNPDVLAADIDPLRHYLTRGWREGRTLHPLFDPAWYLEAYPEVAERKRDPLSHFLALGWKEGKRPHPLFDMKWYLQENADIARAGINPWLHYIQAGWREGRSPNSNFDAPWYISSYLNALTQTREPLAHYLEDGWQEGLLPSPHSPPEPARSGSVAPLYLQAVAEFSRVEPEVAKMGSRGVVVLVTHETEVGGAPHVLKQFALWLRDRTRFDIRIVALRGGNLRHAFAEVAPLLVLADHPEDRRPDILKDWIGDDVRGVFLNSIASGSFLQAMPQGLPTVAFIHELPQVLDLFPTEVDLVRAHADRVIGGGPDVTQALQTQYGFAPEKLVSAFSFVEALPRDTDFAKRRAAARAALGVSEDPIVVMGCGLLHPRKSPDKFIEVAERVLDQGINAEFIWLGGGPDHAACKAMVVEKGLEDRVRFPGYEPDVPGKLAGADVFLLSSQEDPFPLVALYAAQAGLPIVCFKEAGGIEGFVASGGGVAVPFFDVPAMAEAVVAYATDSQRRTRDGSVGQKKVQRHHTIDVVGPLLMHHLREVMGMAPDVTVVVPNYNYEAYLPERLDSIAEQTFQDFEVVLLDDASPDGSVSVLEDFADRRPGTRVHVNAENSGSPFVQWMRGMDMARSELIWLAEADDRCKPEFLQTLLPLFDDRNVRIASCASQPVTAEGAIIGDYRPLYLDRITPGRWDHDYVATDHEEANTGLGIANSIPNASAVMFRKFRPEPDFVRELTEMRLCGDWYFYVRAMRGGLVGFSAKLLNDHRRHGNTVTHKLEGSLRYFTELATVRSYLERTYRQSLETKARIAEFLDQDITRFGVTDPDALPKFSERDKTLPSLLMVAPDLSPGGGQIFAITIANEWTRRGGRAVLLNVGNQPSHPAMVAKIAPEVILIEATQEGSDLGTLIKRFDLDVVHSGIWWADRWVDTNRDALPDDMPWVISMHGCHETIIANPDVDASFRERMERMIKRATWVYTADKNLKVFDSIGKPATLTRIANGMNTEPVREILHRKDLGLREEAIVLCLASRAIASKGWHEAVRLVSRLNSESYPVDLMLIGEGAVADQIRRDDPLHVRLVGQVSNLQDYLAIADIGILPSYFEGESLPLVLLEMMAKGLPLVATEIGEIPWIIGKGEEAAGLLVPLANSGVDEEALYAAILHLIINPEERYTKKAASRKRFETWFTIEKMVDSYLDVYQSHRSA